jgi:hypothetical protein
MHTSLHAFVRRTPYRTHALSEGDEPGSRQNTRKTRLNVDFMSIPLDKTPDAARLASGWNEV